MSAANSSCASGQPLRSASVSLASPLATEASTRCTRRAIARQRQAQRRRPSGVRTKGSVEQQTSRGGVCRGLTPRGTSPHDPRALAGDRHVCITTHDYSNPTPGQRRAVVIGAIASHAFAAGSYRSTVFIGPTVSTLTPPKTYSVPHSTAAPGAKRAIVIGATASHTFVAGSYRSTELKLSARPPTSAPPTAYNLPSSTATAGPCRTEPIGATISHAFVAGQYRSTELRRL
mmetsp:Transcript_35932/g.118310  ORF Transcript_35932/g.118310 Transcript_35932/m.118310 type:complete len:231 (-) Transcript_35932:186-878(-)